MTTRRLVAAVGVLAAGVVPAAATASSSTPNSSAPKTSHAIYWKNAKDTFDCGIEAHAKGTPATLMLCSADAVPQPTGVPHDGDPALQLGAHGKAKLIESHDSTYESDGKNELALPTNSTWKGAGVSCKVGAKNVTCTNKDGHGFEMGHLVYKKF